MSDLINRQDAIDALDRIGSVDTYADRDYAKGIFKSILSAQRWIPCSERLPEEGLYVVTNKWHHIDFLYYQRGRGWYHGNQQDIEGKPTIIAWMPLPDPYKEDDR